MINLLIKILNRKKHSTSDTLEFVLLRRLSSTNNKNIERGIYSGIFFSLFAPIHAYAWTVGSLISDAASAVGGKMVDLITGAIGSIVEGIAHIIFNGAGIFMAMMGSILDMSINFTVQSAVFKNVGAIQVGWTAVRDFSNMFFIFVLLYIAILTILGMAGSNAKRWVAHLVIAALLINFSLFATQVVVDAGNVLAVGFWDKMTMTVGGKTEPTASLWFMEAFRVQTTADTNGNALDPSAKPIESNHTKMILIYLGGTLVYLVAGYVFLAGAVMMVIRSVTLMILMIVSPFAFLGFALPKGGGFANQWLNKLIGSTFVAPAFIFMLYIDSLIIRGTTAAGSEWMKGTSADKAKWALAFGGSADNFAIVYNFLLMIILLLAALKVADAVSSGAGSAAGGWAKKGLGGGAAAGFTGIAAFGRQTYGAAGKRAMNDKDWVTAQQRLVQKGGMTGRLANIRLATAERASKGTFDIRNAPMGGLGVAAGLGAAGIKAGTASKKSFDTHGGVVGRVVSDQNYKGSLKEAEIIKTANERYKNNPKARDEYLKQQLGGQYEKSRHEELRSGLNKDIAKEEAKETLGKANTDYNAIAEKENFAGEKTKLATLNTEKKKLEDEGKTISEELTTSIKESSKRVQDINDMLEGTAGNPGPAMLARQSVANLTGDQVAKLVDKKEYANSAGLKQALRASDYAAINKRYMEGGYKETMKGGADRQMMESLTVSALKDPNVPENAKKAIKNAMKNGTWGHNIDFQSDIAGIVSSGKDEFGNYISKPTPLSAQDKKELDEYYSMLDNDDVASLHDSLHSNPHLVEKYSPKTLAAINKKQYEVGGDTNVEYVKNIRDAVEQSKNEKAKTYINNNTKKETSIFKGQAPITTTTSAAEVKAGKDWDEAQKENAQRDKASAAQKESARWRELAAKTTLTPTEQSELKDLTDKRA